MLYHHQNPQKNQNNETNEKTVSITISVCSNTAVSTKLRPSDRKQLNGTELMTVDRDFNRRVQHEGLAPAFDHYLANNFLDLNGPYEGSNRDDFVVWFKENDGKHQMKWWPVVSQISASKDLGYTWDRYEEQTTQQDGPVVKKGGEYITVWRKNAKGEWKSAVDMGANYPADTPQ